MFSLVRSLSSTPSAGGRPPLFRRFAGTCEAVRLPIHVHVGLMAHGLSPTGPPRLGFGREWGLSVLAHGVSIRRWGLRLRGAFQGLAMATPSVLPSVCSTTSAPRTGMISELNTQPACAPVNASTSALRRTSHEAGSGWIANPFLCDSFIRNSMSVYPDAIRARLLAPLRRDVRRLGPGHTRIRLPCNGIDSYCLPPRSPRAFACLLWG